MIGADANLASSCLCGEFISIGSADMHASLRLPDPAENHFAYGIVSAHSASP